MSTPNTVSAPWFDEHGWILREIPPECVSDCTGPGPADDAVAYWRAQLGFDVPLDLAIAWLREFGAWSLEELQASTAAELADRCLWLACGDIAERGEWLGLIH